MDEATRKQLLSDYAAGRRNLLSLGALRETAALRTVVHRIADLALGEVLWRTFGLTNPHLAWYAFELPTRNFLGDEPEAKTPGDIDLLVGALEPTKPMDEVRRLVQEDPELQPFANSSFIWKLLASRGLLSWPPKFTHLAAVEARVGRWFADDKQHGLQNERAGYTEKARGLVSMGFDSVVLLHLVSTEAIGGEGFSAWQAASSQAMKAADFFEHRKHIGIDGVAEGPFGADEDEFAEVVWPLGSVPHKSEFFAGAGVPFLLRKAAPRRELRSRGRELRASVEGYLKQQLGSLESPGYAPVFVHRYRKTGPRLRLSPEVFGLVGPAQKSS